MHKLEIKLCGGPNEVRRARDALLDRLPGSLSDVVTGDAALLASELVSNMIQHTSGIGTMQVTFIAGVLRIEVTDESPEMPTISPRAPMTVGGHGLRLVNAIAHRWGVDPMPAGKTVWFELVA